MFGNIFGVSKKDILKAEHELGFMLPDDLKTYWLDVGYGRFLNNLDNENRLFSPQEVVDFRNKKGEFKKRGYVKKEKNKVHFFMENEDNIYAIDLYDNCIYIGKEKVMDSIWDFVSWIGG